MPFSKLWGAFVAYAAHPDPLVGTANKVSLIVASNQPFYPLYLYWLIGDKIEPSYFTFFSTPFFLAVPALSRLDTRAGRALLPLTGIANTVLCAKLFGVQSAVEVFLIPCAVLALLIFRPPERWLAYLLAGLTFLVFLVLHSRYGQPVYLYSNDEYRALISLNAMSAAALTALTALMFSNVLAGAERSGRSG